ncbi:MAG TPA: hypothetical protein VGM57_10650 [Pseudolabrys sp.]
MDVHPGILLFSFEKKLFARVRLTPVREKLLLEHNVNNMASDWLQVVLQVMGRVTVFGRHQVDLESGA